MPLLSEDEKREHLVWLAYSEVKAKCDALGLELDEWSDLLEHERDVYRVIFNAGVIHGKAQITWIKP